MTLVSFPVLINNELIDVISIRFLKKFWLRKLRNSLYIITKVETKDNDESSLLMFPNSSDNDQAEIFAGHPLAEIERMAKYQKELDANS